MEMFLNICALLVIFKLKIEKRMYKIGLYRVSHGPDSIKLAYSGGILLLLITPLYYLFIYI